MSAEPTARFHIGHVPVDAVTLTEAIDRIVWLARKGQGGTVYTPNVDHVVVASEKEEFREAYREVSLSLVDGMPVFWGLKWLGDPIPEKVSGSDLFDPLVERLAREGLSLFLFGGGPGVAELARDRLCSRFPGLQVAGTLCPRISADGVLENETSTLELLSASGAAVIFVACGAPKSELFCHKVRTRLGPQVLVCVGAAIDFAAGTQKRAPRWISRLGLEWAYRLVREPRRLARRYLLRDPKFFAILLSEARNRKRARSLGGGRPFP